VCKIWTKNSQPFGEKMSEKLRGIFDSHCRPCLRFCHHGAAIARVHPVHLNVKLSAKTSIDSNVRIAAPLWTRERAFHLYSPDIASRYLSNFAVIN